ncbi:type VI secretion system ImpA family N-terminal domain-containing protein (plasmid) [Burkholderia sp. FERM BP-3421]|uniref:type VI secretion system protein TssA n=1 Tax=Burkholderia sp. FERM BP-3421 TaxID=1494466 RepID=UPI002362ACB6|nr:type VI secretion system ImpA family N-terminal domain-containing protein [Burkholderia sp. FERM BP-3421]WDD90209.1 type VI secretion system ImpA family N-terminal domain-containing protein [Burkholderia sp. FERM BP-3421]
MNSSACSIERNEDYIFVDSMVHEIDSYGESPNVDEGCGPNWGVIEKACIRLLEKGGDVRVAIWYIRAVLERKDFHAFRLGMETLSKILAGFQRKARDSYHPDELELEVYLAQVAWLSTPQFARMLRVQSFPEIDASISDIHQNTFGPFVPDESVDKLCGEIQEVVGFFEEVRGWVDSHSDQRIDLDDSISLLADVVMVLRRAAGKSTQEDRGIVSHESKDIRRGNLATISNRADVDSALDAIISYFKVHEPSHPAPILLMRVKKIVGADFSELMQELYAEGVMLVAQLGRLGGVDK